MCLRKESTVERQIVLAALRGGKSDRRVVKSSSAWSIGRARLARYCVGRLAVNRDRKYQSNQIKARLKKNRFYILYNISRQ